MNPLRIALFALAVAASAQLSAQPPKDNFGDPLPEGAKARAGTPRMVKTGPWALAQWLGATLTPDGKFLLSSAADGTIEKLDVATGLSVGTIGALTPSRDIRGLHRLSADGTRGVSARGKTITMWDAKTGEEIRSIQSPQSLGRLGVTLSSDGSTLAFGDSLKPPPGADMPVAPYTAVVWDYGAGKRRLEVETGSDCYECIAISADGKTLATWGVDSPSGSLVKFWDATNGRQLGTLTIRKSVVASVVFPARGRLVAVSDEDGGVILADPKTGRELKRLATTSPWWHAIAFSPDGTILATGDHDGGVSLWDAATATLLSTTKSPVLIWHTPVQLIFTGEKQLVVLAVENSRAIVWEVPSGKLLSPFGGHTKEPESLAFTPDGKELLSNGTRWTAFRWDTATGKPLGSVAFDIPGKSDHINYHHVQLFPGGTRTLTSAGEKLYIHDARTGKLMRELSTRSWLETPLTDAEGTLTLTPVGRSDTRSLPWTMKVRDLATDKAITEFVLPGGTFYVLPIRTQDRARLIVPLYISNPPDDREPFVVQLWDLTTGKKSGEVSSVVDLKDLSLAPGPNNTVLLSDATYGVRVLDFTGKATRDIDIGRLTVSAGPVVSPDGKRFAVGLRGTATQDGTFEVRIYDVETCKPLKIFRGHTGRVSTLTFSSDGKTLASGSHDTTVLLWDLTTIPAPK